MIPEQMALFVQELKKKFQQEMDPYEFAAWVHMTYVNIHPHLDGNGRMARILMYIVLLQKGKRAPNFDNDLNYTHAINSQDVQQFASYLKKLVAEQEEMPNFLDDCLRSLAKNTTEG